MKKFRVHVDACRVGRGIGAILLQVDDNILLAEKREVWPEHYLKKNEDTQQLN